MSKTAKEPARRVRLSLEEMARGDGPPVGVRCPKCWCMRSHVDATRDGPGQSGQWRVCDNCGTGWRTDEK